MSDICNSNNEASYQRKLIQWLFDTGAMALFVLGSMFFLMSSVWFFKNESLQKALKINVVASVLYLVGSIQFLISLIIFSRPKKSNANHSTMSSIV